MKPIKRKYKPTIVCDKCHKSIGKTKPSYKKVGEIEYRYWRCRHCSTVYVISATDAELRICRKQARIGREENIMLILPIKSKWFNMILSGDKQEEYREIKPYYTTRFKKINQRKERLLNAAGNIYGTLPL